MHPSGLLTAPHDRGLRPAGRERLAPRRRRRRTRTARSSSCSSSTAGASRSTPRRARPRSHRRRCRRQRFKVEPRALSAREIEELVDGTTRCAGHAREGGSTASSCARRTATSPRSSCAERSNRRDDAYDGDAERRLHFAREVLGAIRRGAGPEIAVGVRLSADETPPEGRDADACARDRCARSRATAWSTSRTPRSATPPRYWARSGSCRRRRSRATRCASPARRCAPALGVPLIATTRVVDLADAERLLAAGAADVVGMTRALIADPDCVAQGRAGAPRRAHPLHRLQPGLHRPLPRRGADRLLQ